MPTISDNDGLWTGCYVAAESLRYAVTGEQEALEKARRGLNAMLLLTRVTGIPGFTARAVRYEGDPGFGHGHVQCLGEHLDTGFDDDAGFTCHTTV